MTQNKRIVLNTVATYGRSIFGVLCGIFSARWVLEALGQVDFGLYTVIGGMAVFLGFLNIQFSGAIGRYYAFSIGQASQEKDETRGLLECRSWFTSAVVIHSVVPVVLLLIGWPLGIHALEHGWIIVPSERLSACVWVWRVICISTLVGMMAVPFQAMYTAKQYIAELTIYSFAQTIVRTAFVYYMTTTQREWLVPYSVAMGIIVILPQIVICWRAYLVFPECRIVPHVLHEFGRIRQIAGYAVWTAFGGLGYVASHQCMSIVINNFFGAKAAGAFGISQTVSSEASSLTAALQSAFQPAVATVCGAGKDAYMRSMAFRICKIGTALTLVFALPMALEIDEFLRLWLREPPLYSAPMCICALAFIVMEKLTSGHLIAVNATGRIAKFQAVRGILRVFVIPMAVVPAYLGWGPVAATAALPLSVLLVDVGDVYLARTAVGMSARQWIRGVVCPAFLMAAIPCAVGCIPRLSMPASIGRVFVTSLFVLISMLPMVWLLLITADERQRLLAVLTRGASRM